MLWVAPDRCGYQRLLVPGVDVGDGGAAIALVSATVALVVFELIELLLQALPPGVAAKKRHGGGKGSGGERTREEQTGGIRPYRTQPP